MTQEEKARAYDEALNKAKIEINTKGIGETVNLCYQLFPELRESEDEGIRKSLIKFLTDIKEISESGRTTWAVRKEDAEMCKSFIAWLEKQKEPENVSASTMIPSCWEVKQKEQEPVERSPEDDHIIGFVYDLLNEIEWKDNWAMSKEECLRLLSNYSPQKITGVTINGELISTENQSVDIPLAEWSEEDKKMLNHLIDKIQENLNIRMPDGYSFGISNDEKETFSSWLRCLPERFNLQPNQKWSEEDEAAYNAFICEVVNEKMNPTIEQVKWLRGICDRLKSFYPQSKQEWNNKDESMLNTIITDVGFVQRKCGIGTDEWNVRSKAIQWLKNLLERFNLPKQEWKEVELEFRGEKVKVKRPFFRDNKGREYSTTEQDEDVAWYALRAWCNKKGILLYDLYPKAEWSDEDESSLKELIHYFESLLDCLATEKRHAENRKWLKFLKSLRPQYHGDVTMTEAYKMGFEAGKASSWKPSKEQMDSLRDTIANTKGYSYSIYLPELYEQLKKLV